MQSFSLVLGRSLILFKIYVLNKKKSEKIFKINIISIIFSLIKTVPVFHYALLSCIVAMEDPIVTYYLHSTTPT